MNSFSGGETGTPMFQPPNGGSWWWVVLAIILVLTIVMWGTK